MFLIDPVNLLGMGFALLWMYPFALMLIPPDRRSALVLALVTLALSLGTLTLGMLALTLIGALRFKVVLIGMAVTVNAALLWLLNTQTVRPDQPPMDRPVYTRAPCVTIDRIKQAARQRPVTFVAILIVIGMGALIAFNTLYWPIHDDDAISIYANFGRDIYQTNRLPTGIGTYEAYPMMLPLSYVFSFQLAGEINEYLAKVTVAALGVGTLGATLALGRVLYDEYTGILAALLLAITPTFTRWASSGYTDIPAAFFVALAALFGWWLREHGTARDAFLLGMMGGLAAWIKNSALIAAGSVGLWVFYLSMRYPDRVRWDRVVWCALGGAITAGPWYLRNWITFGLLVPDTAWTEQAQHTVANLVPFLTRRDLYGWPGIALTLGLAATALALLRGHRDQRDRSLLLLLMTLPLAAAWWWAASYDARFLLAILPLIAVMGGHALATLTSFAAQMARFRALTVARPLIIVVIIALAVPAAMQAVIFKDEIARDPFMDDTARHQLTLGPIYDVAVYLNALPAEGRILSSNYFLAFHVVRAGITEIVIGEPTQRANLADYDYLVTEAGARLFQTIEPGDVELLTQIGEFAVYRVTYDEVETSE